MGGQPGVFLSHTRTVQLSKHVAVGLGPAAGSPGEQAGDAGFVV